MGTAAEDTGPGEIVATERTAAAARTAVATVRTAAVGIVVEHTIVRDTAAAERTEVGRSLVASELALLVVDIVAAGHRPQR